MVLTEYDIPCSNGIGGTIALISDFHEKDPDDTISLLRQAQPDIICIAGDTFERYGVGDDPRMKENPTKLQKFILKMAFVLNDIVYSVMGNRRECNPENIYRFIREVSRIRNRNGKKAAVYMSLGNHEWRLYKRDKNALSEAGITLLNNDDVEIGGIRIGGLSTKVDEVWLSDFSHKKGYKILLCHHPEYYDKYLKDKDIDIVLSGHAHGGQIRIFGRGLFAPGQGLFPKYHHGVYEGRGSYDSRLVVSSGCANTASIPRWGNPCEVVIVRLIAS